MKGQLFHKICAGSTFPGHIGRQLMSLLTWVTWLQNEVTKMQLLHSLFISHVFTKEEDGGINLHIYNVDISREKWQACVNTSDMHIIDTVANYLLSTGMRGIYREHKGHTIQARCCIGCFMAQPFTS